MKNYKMNFATKTITVTKDFANAAVSNPASKESQILEQCRRLCPDLKIAYYTHKATKNKPYGGMTYTKIEEYIKLYENANELLAMFYLVKELAKIQKNKRKFVYDWFISQFPDYEKIPQIKEGKLCASVVCIPGVENNLLQAA